MNLYETSVGAIERVEVKLGIPPDPPATLPRYWRRPANEVIVAGWDTEVESFSDGDGESGPMPPTEWLRIDLLGEAGDALTEWGPEEERPDRPAIHLPPPMHVTHTTSAAVLYWRGTDGFMVVLRLPKLPRERVEQLVPVAGSRHEAGGTDGVGSRQQLAEQLSSLGRVRS